MSEPRLAENLKFLREINEYRQKDVSSQINVARQTYSAYENGRRVPDIDTLRSISRLYDVSIVSLLDADLAHPFSDETPARLHDASAPDGSHILLSGSEAKMLNNYRSLSASAQAEVREFVRFKKSREEKKS